VDSIHRFLGERKLRGFPPERRRVLRLSPAEIDCRLLEAGLEPRNNLAAGDGLATVYKHFGKSPTTGLPTFIVRSGSTTQS
jgi:hypothetical protein